VAAGVVERCVKLYFFFFFVQVLFFRNPNLEKKKISLKAGKCGKIIAKNEKTVPKGHYVYEFNHNIQHQKNGKYVFGTSVSVRWFRV
jgi:hypothetical protein